MGMALQLVTAGYLADYWGWPAIFYANGTVGAIWTIAYVFFGSDSPQKSKMISAEERLYIQTSLGQTGEQKVSKGFRIILKLVITKYLLYVHTTLTYYFSISLSLVLFSCFFE